MHASHHRAVGVDPVRARVCHVAGGCRRSRRRRPASSRAPCRTVGGRLPGATVTLLNTGTNFTRELIDRRRRPLPGPAAAARHVHADRVPGGLLHATSRRASSSPSARPPTSRSSCRSAGLEQKVTVTRRLAGGRDDPGRAVDAHRSAGDRAACRTTAATSSASCSSRPASPSCRAPTATRSASTARRASPTTSRWTAPTSTTRSSASSAAASGRRSRSTRTPSRRWWSSPTAPRPSSAAADPASSTSSPSRAPTTRPARRTSSSKHDALSTKNSDGREVPVRSAAVRRDARRAAAAGQAVLLPGLRRAAVRPDQAARPAPHRAARRRLVRVARQPGRERPDRPHQRRPRVPRQGRLRSSTPTNLLTLRYNYTWSEQQNGTFDVDSWGRSANAVERDFSNAVLGVAADDALEHDAERVPVPVRARGSAAALRRARTSAGQSRPFPDTAFDFGSGYRFGDAVLHPGRVLRHARPVRGQPVVDQGPAHDQGRLRVQPRQLGRRRSSASPTAATSSAAPTASSTTRSFGPKYVECSNGSTQHHRAVPGRRQHHRPAAALPAAGRRRRPDVEEAGTQDIPQTEPALFIQDKWQPTRNLTVSYGLRWEAQIQPDLITPRDQLFYREFLDNPAFPVRRHDPVGHEDVAAAPGHLVGSRRRRQAGRPRQRRDVLRAHPGPEPGEHALDRRQPRARRCSAPAPSTASASRRRRGRT